MPASMSGFMTMKGLFAMMGAGVLGYAFGRWTRVYPNVLAARLTQEPGPRLAVFVERVQSLDIAWEDDDVVKQRFVDAFPLLVDAFVQKIEDMGIPRSFAPRVVKLCRYNVLGGKYNRGLVLVQNTRDLCQQLKLDFFALADQAIVLGWCIEILQACFLVSDDVMDKSVTRRGKPCWYRLPEVQLDAVNDALILESFIYFLLQERFEFHPNYNQFLTMFHEVSLKTQMGQMLDLLSQPQGRKGPEVLAAFSTDLHRLIVEFKTAYYTFYIPIASSMMLCGMNSPEALAIAQRISVQLGIKFQIQDDFLDLYGDPKHIGKIGTDLQDHKCSWLLVKALERANPEQRKIIEQNLGHDEPESLISMRKLYDELGLPQLYSEQEESSYQEIIGLIHKHADRVPPVVFTTALARIQNRSK